jgi:DNA-binding NarL/FixJ family response regulator
MERKRNGNSHPKVCLLSTHPLLLDEFTRKLSRSHFTVKAFRLRQVFFEDVDRLAIPGANIYVVDGHDAFAPVLIGALLKRFPNSRVIVLSEKFTDSTAFPLLDLGVKGLLDYSEASMHLPEAVSVVSRGGYWVERQLLSRFMGSMVHSSRRRFAKAGSARLSPREREVLQCLLGNLSNKEIARKLKISERTAKFHVSNLLAKFDVKRRLDLNRLLSQDERS